MPLIQDIDLLYPAATILLDLTADEEFIENVAKVMIKFGVFEYVIYDKLSLLIHLNSRLGTSQMKKLRDLFIGMVLNLACNIED